MFGRQARFLSFSVLWLRTTCSSTSLWLKKNKLFFGNINSYACEGAQILSHANIKLLKILSLKGQIGSSRVMLIVKGMFFFPKTDGFLFLFSIFTIIKSSLYHIILEFDEFQSLDLFSSIIDKTSILFPKRIIDSKSKFYTYMWL